MRTSAFALSLLLAAIPLVSEAQSISLPVSIGNSAISERVAVTGEAIYAYYDYASTRFTNIALKWTAQDGPRAVPPTLSLVFSVYTPDPASLVCTTDPNYGTFCNYTRTWVENGSGEVPVTDGWFTPDGAGVTTSITRPGFTYDRCLFDGATFAFTCGLAPASGVTDVTVTWDRLPDSPPASAQTRVKRGAGNLVECALFGCARPDLYSPITRELKVRLDQARSRATGSLLGQPLTDVTGPMPAGADGAATSYVEQKRTVVIDLLP